MKEHNDKLKAKKQRLLLRISYYQKWKLKYHQKQIKERKYASEGVVKDDEEDERISEEMQNTREGTSSDARLARSNTSFPKLCVIKSRVSSTRILNLYSDG